MARSAGNSAADILFRSTASIARPNADETCSKLAMRLMPAQRLVPAAWKTAGLEAQVIIAVHGLGRAAGVDHVDLRGDLVGGAEPGVAHGRDDVVGVVGREDIWRAQGQLLQCVPDPIVLPGLGEMIAGGAASRALIGDDRLELRRGPIDYAWI